MDNAAAIIAQLVDVRNLGTEKCVKLTLHAPVEQAEEILAAFGWPTRVDPVPVAVARLNIPDPSTQDGRAAASDQGKPVAPPPQGSKERRSFTSLPLAQQAALLCQDKLFQAFLREQCREPCNSEAEAAAVIRIRCGVKSRADIQSNLRALAQFTQDRDRFIAWKLAEAL